MEKLPNELILEIIKFSHINTISNWSRLNKFYNSLIKNHLNSWIKEKKIEKRLIKKWKKQFFKLFHI